MKSLSSSRDADECLGVDKFFLTFDLSSGYCPMSFSQDLDPCHVVPNFSPPKTHLQELAMMESVK